jgi:thioredoxin reductase (NADPH)
MSETTDEAAEFASLGTTAAVPQLSAAQFARLTAYAVPERVAAGDVVFSPGDIDYDLIVIESGRIEIVSPASRDDPEAVVAVYEGGGFLGELNFLTGQTAYLIGRVADAGRIHRISREQFRRVLAEDPEVSDILVRTFLARRDLLRGGPAARGIAILGSGSPARASLCAPSPPASVYRICGWTPTAPPAAHSSTRPTCSHRICPPSSPPTMFSARRRPERWRSFWGCRIGATPTTWSI